MPLRSDSENFALIRVIGVGGGGSNAVNRMIRAEMMGVEFIACNTDAQALLQSDAPHKIRIGDKITRGLGAGGDASIGQRAAEEDTEKIAEALATRTWSSSPPASAAAPGRARRRSIAEIAKELGALTIGVVTKPFTFEGDRAQARRREGGRGAQGQGRHAHHDPQRPPRATSSRRTPRSSTRSGSSTTCSARASRGSATSSPCPGLINLDFADVRTIMRDAGSALMGIGRASGENRAVEAARQAIASPLLEVNITGAQGILFNITGSSNLSLFEVTEAAEEIRAAADPEANIIFGTSFNERLGDEVMITVIATGFDAAPQARRRARSATAGAGWRGPVDSARRA